MLPPRILLSLIALCLGGAAAGSAQNPWCAYRLGTLHDAIDTTYKRAFVDTTTREVFHVKASVVYTAQRRELPASVAAFLDDAALPPGYRKQLRDEVLVREAGDSFWLVSPDTLLATLGRQARAHDTIVVFADVWGVNLRYSEWEWIIAMREFAGKEDWPAWGSILQNCRR